MKGLYFLVYIGISILFTAVQAFGETAAAKGNPIEITIHRESPYQKMDGIGVNSYTFPFASDLGWKWDKVKYVFDELNIEYVRLATWFNLWEPENDDNDPYHFTWNRFDPNKIAKYHDLGMIKFLKDRNIDVSLGIWSFGSWLAGNDPQTIPDSKFPEMGESIAGYLLWMKDQGYPLDHAEVQNEPDIAAKVIYSSPEKLKKAHLELINQLNRNGLQNITLHLPNLSTPKNTASWGGVLLADDQIKNKTEAVSYHTWWVSDEAEYRKIWDFAYKENKPVWATEVGYCALPGGCFGGKNYLRPETWETAWDYAMSYYRAIAWSHASRVYHWTLLGHDAAVGKEGQKFPSFYILKHFANYIPKDSVLVMSEPKDPAVLSLVFETKEEDINAIFINTSSKMVRVSLRFSTKEKPTLVEAYSSSNGYYWKQTPSTQGSDQAPILELLPNSITSSHFILQTGG